MKKLLVIAFCLMAFVVFMRFRFPPSPQSAVLAAPVQAVAPVMAIQSATPSPVWISAATNDPRLNAEMTLLFIHATDTQVSIAKTEQAIYDAQATNAEYQRLQSIQMTEQAYQVAQAQTAAATQTQGIQTAYAAYTFSAQTAQATQTSGQATAGAGATATQLAATQQIERDKTNAARMGIWGAVFLALAAGTFCVGFLGVRLWNLYLNGKANYIRDTMNEPDQHGRYKAMSSAAFGKGEKLVMPSLAIQPVTDPHAPNEMTAEQAMTMKRSHDELEAVRAFSDALSASALLAKQYNKKTPVNTDPALPQSDLQITKPEQSLLMDRQSISRPDWSIMESWDGKGAIPLGVTSSGVLRVDLASNHHFGVFGATGEGKSRYLLRPFIAALLAAGQRVVIIGKSGDFWPFANHPNCKMIVVRQVTKPEQAERYAGYLRRMVDEMDRRDEYLTNHHVSTWDRAGHPATYVVLDEVGNALSKMPPKIQQDAYRWLDSLAREGRKAGFNLITASQRAVGFKSIVEQMRRIVFHVEDADTSRIALGSPGAEDLPTNSGQFFARIGGVNRCAAFNPDDDQLIAFLNRQSVHALEPIDWIEGVEVKDTQPVPAIEKTFKPDVQPVDEIAMLAESIRSQWQPGMSLNQTSSLLGKPYAGNSWCAKVKEISNYLSSTTTTTNGNKPGLDPLAA